MNKSPLQKIREFFMGRDTGLVDKHGNPIIKQGDTDDMCNGDCEIIITSRPFLKEHVSSPSKQGSSKSKWEIFREWYLAILATVTIGLGTWAGVVYKGQLDAMKVQMQANLRQAKAAEQQSIEMHEDFVADQRAWVVVHHSEIQNGQNPTNVAFKVVFENIGKTPALAVSSMVNEGADVTNGFKELTNRFDFHRSDTEILAPNLTSFNHTSDFSPLIKTFIELGGKYYLWGEIGYKDIFGQQHWTTFCYQFIDGNWNYAGGPFGNACDDATNSPGN